MAGQALPPDSNSQLSPSSAPVLSPALQQHSSVSTSSASGGSGLASSLVSGLMSTLGGMATGSTSSQVTSASASSRSAPQQHNAPMQQQTLPNPSSQPSMLGHHVNLQTYQQSLQNQQTNAAAHLQTQMPGQSSGGQSTGFNSSVQHLAQQQNQHSSQQALGQNSHLAQQMLNQNQQQQQQGRQPQYLQNLQMSSQVQQQGSSLQQGTSNSQNQPLHNIPRISSAQRLLQMQQPGGGVAAMRASALVAGGPHFNHQLSPSLSGSLSGASSGGMQAMSSNLLLQQQQLLAQRGYHGQPQNSMAAQQRLQQTTQQASQLSQQNQHPLQSQQVPAPNQSMAQQLHPSSRPSLYSQSQQSIGSQFGLHLNQPVGFSSRLGAGSGTTQVQGPGLPSMLSVPPVQSFVGLQSQLASPQQALQARQKQAQAQSPQFQAGTAPSPPLQVLPTMAMMGAGGLSVAGGLATQLTRASAPLMAQQQRMQQQGARLQQQTQQQTQQQQQQPSNLLSPSKQQNLQQASRSPSIGSFGSQMQNLASAQQNSSLLPQTQSWLPAGQLKPMHNQSPSVPYHSQVQQQQLQASQQRSDQQQSASQQQQQPSPEQKQQQQSPVPLPSPVPSQAPSQQQEGAQGSASQQPTTPTGPQSTPRGSVVPAITAGPSSQASDSSGKTLGKRSIQDLVSQVDPLEKVDPDLEDVLLEIADNFVETVTSFACSLAKHRNSSMLDAKDVLLHLERNWHLTIPGFAGDDYQAHKKPSISETRKQRLAVVRKLLASRHPTQEIRGVLPPGAEKSNSGSQLAKTIPTTVPITAPRVHRVW